MIRYLFIVFGVVLFVPAEAYAAPGVDALTVTTNPDGTQDYTMTLQVLAIMTALSLLPAFIMMMTSFTRIIIVLSILRQAIGLQQSPSNQVLIGVSLFLSMFIMAPVFEQINENALQPYLNEDRKSTRLNSSHANNSYAVFCLKKKKQHTTVHTETADQQKEQTIRQVTIIRRCD